MKKINILTIAIPLLIFVSEAAAQQKIDPTLEVRRDFDARLLEITKGKLYTEFADSLGNFNLSFKYTIFDKPIKELYEFSPLPSARIERSPNQKHSLLSLKMGTLSPLQPFASLHIQPITQGKFRLSAYGKHSSFYGKLPAIIVDEGPMIKRSELKSYAPSSNTNGGVALSYSWSGGIIGADAYTGKYLESYYGYSNTLYSLHNRDYMKDSLSHRFSKTGARVYAGSKNRENDSFIYNLDIGYLKTKDKARFELPGNFRESDLDEDYFDISLTLGAGFMGNNKLLAQINYKTANSLHSDSLDRSNLELHPRYIFKKGRWDLELGFKYNRQWERGQDDFNIYLSSSAKLELIKNRVWAYALVDGTNNFNTYGKMLESNPWIYPGIELRNTEQPFMAKAGISGKIKELITWNLYGGYYEYKNRAYFYSHFNYPNPVNSLSAAYQDEKRTGIGAEVLFKKESVEGGINLDLYSYRDNNNKTDLHYNLTPFELKSWLRYSWRERLIFSGTLNYIQKTPHFIQSEVYSSTQPLTLLPIELKRYTPSYALLNLDVTYVYNRNISLFAKAVNILNSEIIYYAKYAMPGISLGGGLVINF